MDYGSHVGFCPGLVPNQLSQVKSPVEPVDTQFGNLVEAESWSCKLCKQNAQKCTMLQRNTSINNVTIHLRVCESRSWIQNVTARKGLSTVSDDVWFGPFQSSVWDSISLSLHITHFFFCQKWLKESKTVQDNVQLYSTVFDGGIKDGAQRRQRATSGLRCVSGVSASMTRWFLMPLESFRCFCCQSKG